MKKSSYLIFLASLIVSLAGCDIKEDLSEPHTMESSYKRVTSEISKLDALSPEVGTSTTSFHWDFNLFSKLYATAFGDNWTLTNNVGLRDPESDDDPTPIISIKEYMGKQFNSELTRPNGSPINVFGRIKNALEIFCAFGSLDLPLDADGYPENGDHAVIFTTAVMEGLAAEDSCNISFEKNEAGDYTMLDQTITLNVTDTTDTSIYDKKLSIDMGANEMSFYMRYNDNVINIVSTEKNISGDNAGHEYRTIIQHDIDGDILRAEYISAPGISENDYLYFYRLYMTSTEARVLAFKGKGTSVDTEHIAYSAAGTLEDSTTTSALSVSISEEKNAASGGAGFSDLNACINRMDGSVDADDAVACGTDLADDSQLSTHVRSLVSNFIESIDEAGWVTVSEANDNLMFDTVAEMFSETPNQP